MKKSYRRILAALVAAMLIVTAAMAETISFEGSIVAGGTREVYAPIGGTVGEVYAAVGQQVKAGDVIASLTTTKVYAAESGTVTGLFGQIGDSAETVAQKYGAVMYIEGESVYTIAASTENAYDATANKFVHVGESVNLSCYSDNKHTGTGVITAIEGTDYTVEVKSGEFLIGETVNIYRGDVKAANRIGRGTLNRKNPTAVTGTGSIVSYAVQDGDRVERGDLLLETLEGSFDGLYMSGSDILSSVAGTVAKVNLEQGGKVEKGSVAAVIYPENSMRIKGSVTEGNLAWIAEGDAVEIELIWNQDEEITYPGTVAMISRIAAESNGAEESETRYDVYVDFTADGNTRYGMNAVVSTVDVYEPIAEAIEDEADY